MSFNGRSYVYSTHMLSYTRVSLKFLCPCIIIIIVNDDQQDESNLACLFIPNQLYILYNEVF